VHPIIIVLLVLPVLAAGILAAVRRSKALSQIMPALVLSGIATALTTAFLAFTNGSVSIAPYEAGPGVWLPVLGQILLALYVGFGIGVIIAALIGLPYHLLAHRKRA